LECRRKSTKEIKCTAQLKILPVKWSRGESLFRAIGCLTHNHSIVAKDLRISREKRTKIKNLLESKISPPDILDLHFPISSVVAQDRPVTMRNILNIKTTVVFDNLDLRKPQVENVVSILHRNEIRSFYLDPILDPGKLPHEISFKRSEGFIVRYIKVYWEINVF
jgi:hypothetical protein